MSSTRRCALVRRLSNAVRGVAVALVVLVTGVPAAAADDLEDLVPWLDADAAVVVRFDPGAVEGLFELLAGEPSAEQLRRLAGLGGAAVLGFNPLVSRGWAGVGLAPDGPVLLSIAAIDRDAAARAAPGSPRAPLWRHRLIARVGDSAMFDRLLRGMALRDRAEVAAGDAAAVARAVGARPGAAARVDEALARAGAIAVARLPVASATVVASVHGEVAVIDVIVPFGGGALQWRHHGAAILRRASAATGPAALSGVARTLMRSGVAAWIRKRELIGAVEALEWTGTQPGSTARRYSRCRTFRDLIGGVSLADAAVHLARDARELTLEVSWAIRDRRLLVALATTGQRVLGPPAAAPIAAVVRVGELGALRGLERPSLLSSPWETPLRAAERCGTGAALLLGFAWPELVGLFLEEVADLDPAADAVVSSLGNVAVRADALGERIRDWAGVAEASLAPAGAAVAGEWLHTLFGHRERRDGGIQWGRGPLRGYAVDVGRRSAIGVAAGEPSLRWALGAAGRTAEGSAVATARVDVAALREASALPPPWDARLARVERAAFELAVDGASLRAVLRARVQ